MSPKLKKKLIMFFAMIAFMSFYFIVFGSKNMVIAMTIVMAAFMSLGNDLSFKPKTSFIKILFLLLILGISAYLNNPLTIWACILTFIIVFLTTFTSYNLFGANVYLPYLMCYFMMIAAPVTLENLPRRLMALAFGAVFIVGLNVVVNKKKDYKLSKATIENLVSEIDNAIDLKLKGEDVSTDNFATTNGLYSAIYNKFEYKYFPTKPQQIALNLIKSFQYIGIVIANYDLSKKELEYVRDVLPKLIEMDPDDIFEDIEFETKEMAVILLNMEIIANETKKDLNEDILLPDRQTIAAYTKPIIKEQFSFKSPKFTFAFKMALMLFIWQILTLVFNLPFTKWLYFITFPLMMPYVDDLEYTAKTRIKGTFLGVFIFIVLFGVLHFITVSFNVLLMGIMVLGTLIMVLKIDNKFILAADTTVMSISASLIYITPPQALILKVLWVVVGVFVVSLFNFKFLPYSVEKETRNNLKTCCELNRISIDLIKQKCNGESGKDKTTILVESNIVREYIKVTDENKELYVLQEQITDICNFILNYLDIYEPSTTLKDNLTNIICNNADVNENLNIKDKVIAYSMHYVMGLYGKEEELI